jgi:CMP-N-acetylneuraminic acid synthetase
MSQPKFTAIITVRENCGYFLPNRNFLTIGRDYTHLYERMIDKLRAVERVDHIIVNTDSANVRSACDRRAGFTVIDTLPRREQEFEPLDLEMSPDSITAAVLDKANGEHFLELGSIFPFLKERTIEEAIHTYDRYVLDPEGRCDALFSITAINRRLYDSDTDTLRQDRPNTFVEDGILHLFNRKTFLENGKSKAGKSPFGYSIDTYENLAIDSEENYRLAELIMENDRFFPSVTR